MSCEVAERDMKLAGGVELVCDLLGYRRSMLDEDGGRAGRSRSVMRWGQPRLEGATTRPRWLRRTTVAFVASRVERAVGRSHPKLLVMVQVGRQCDDRIGRTGGAGVKLRREEGSR